MSQDTMEQPTPHADSAQSQEHTRDARLVAIETRQKLRDEHVDRRFDAMGAEFSSLDRRVSSQIGELNLKIDAGFRSLTDELKSDRNVAESRVSKMYEDWRVERDSESKRPASVKVSMLLGFLGVVFPTLTLAGGVIMLVVNPIKETLDNHVKNGPHWNGESKIALLEARTVSSAETTEAALLAQTQAIAKLQEQRVLDAERWGRLNVTDEWLRDDLKALKEDIDRHAKQPEHPDSTNAAEIARIQGAIGALMKRMGYSAETGSLKLQDQEVRP